MTDFEREYFAREIHELCAPYHAIEMVACSERVDRWEALANAYAHRGGTSYEWRVIMRGYRMARAADLRRLARTYPESQAFPALLASLYAA